MLQLFRSKSEYIFNFQIYGERHSGTKFLQQSIKDTFQIPETSFFGHKHWMGFAKPERIAYERHTLFVGIIRDPYDWILALYDLPHHIPQCNRSNFHNFLFNEHYSIHQNGAEVLHDRNFTKVNKPRYKNIFELRSNKAKYLNEIMPEIASNYILVTYESLLENLNNIINIISSRYNLLKKGNPPSPKPIYKRNFSSIDEQNFVTLNIDWNTETKLGYYPR